MKIFIEDERGQQVRVYPVHEVASKCGYEPRHIRHLADTGKMRGWKVGGRWLVAPDRPQTIKTE